MRIVQSAPTSMQAIRSTVAYGSLHPKAKNEIDDAEATQADAEQAYIQRKLEPGENLFVVIPKELWTPAMIESAKGIEDPVFRLLRPLYGWARSGNLWEKHLDETLTTMLSTEDREKVNKQSIELQTIETHQETLKRIKGFRSLDASVRLAPNFHQNRGIRKTYSAYSICRRYDHERTGA